MGRGPAVLSASLTLALVFPYAAEEHIASDVNARIREEASSRSQIMSTLHVLTDAYGPRLTGSPSLKQAGEWAVGQMESWGLVNGRMEPWPWGHPGWRNEVASGAMIAPASASLSFTVLAWTPSTDGTIAARAFNLVPPERPTEEQLTTYLDSVGDRVKGSIVLVGSHRAVPVNFTPPTPRRTEEQLERMFAPSAPPAGEGRGRRGGAGPPAQGPPALSAARISQAIDAFLRNNGAKLRINDAGRPHGQIVAFQNRTYDITQTVPTVVMRNEDYGRITRLLGSGRDVELQFTITNRTYPEGRIAYNATADIAGGDLAHEVVMLGAHLDSWHAATGATDNAAGCAVMMEAARILRALDVRPRRTIRVALWSGEEQGLLGSQAYVAEHFGTAETPKASFEHLSAYLNLDHGTGRIRGATVFGPQAAAETLRLLLAPFAELGVAGAAATASRALGGTDHTSFNRAGLPGINFTQDPIEYSTHTHHTNLDTYERIVEDDVKASAMVVASVAYHLAMRGDKLARFSPEEMPQASE